MFLVAGLGNPQARHATNRHNVGFLVVNELARRAGVALSTARFDGRAVKTSLGRAEVLLLQPMTYMNRSGGPVASALRFFKLEPDHQLVVIHDELDLEFGVVRVKVGGGTAGHNGLRSIADSIGTTDFVRVRIGIGKPEAGGSVTAHVLSDFSVQERTALSSIVDGAADAVETILSDGPIAAMNRHNAPAKSRAPLSEEPEN